MESPTSDRHVQMGFYLNEYLQGTNLAVQAIIVGACLSIFSLLLCLWIAVHALAEDIVTLLSVLRTVLRAFNVRRA